MTAFDRSKFKATVVATTKQVDQELDSLVKNKDFNSADFINIKDLGSGTYKVRIYPPHPDDGGEQFAESKMVHWLEVDKPEYKDGKPVFERDGKTPVLKRGPKPFFNSRVHGGTDLDLVEEYIKYAEKIAKETYPTDTNQQKVFLEPIFGGYNSKYKGILGRLSWVMYVDLIKENGSKVFGRFEITKAIKQRLNQIAGIEGDNDPLGTDPFTDPSTGRAVIITHNAKATRSQDYYLTEIDSSFDRKTQKINLCPLSDDDLEKFIKYPSLYKLYKSAYKRKDFDQVLAGLKIFDDAYKIGVFQYDEFLDIAEKISNYYPEEDSIQQAPSAIKKEMSAESVKEKVVGAISSKITSSEQEIVVRQGEVSKEKSETDAFDDMDREELKDFCKENKTGIIIANKTTDDAIRAKLREWYQVTQTPIQDSSIKSSSIDEEREEEDGLPWRKDGTEIPNHPAITTREKMATGVATTQSAKDRVAAIRKNLGKK